MATAKDNSELNSCKFCGVKIPGAYARNHSAKVYCNSDCRKARQANNKHNVPCIVCKKIVTRYKSQKSRWKSVTCSLVCQRHYALIENHSSAGKADWIKKSAEAKKRWGVSDSRRRRLCNPWMRKISKKLKKCKESKVDTNSWEYRVAIRLNAAVGRKRRKRVNASASRTVEQALRKIREKRKLFEIPNWEKKIGWKLSSHSARRARKQNAQKHRQVEGVSDRCQDKGKWVQVCFKWVAD